jgi:hypothetical protein
MMVDEDLREKIDAQAVIYENQREAFASLMAIKMHKQGIHVSILKLIAFHPFSACNI